MKIIETCPKCGCELVDLMICTYPPIPEKRCFNCGWNWIGEAEEVVRVPFGGNSNFDTVTRPETLTTRLTPIAPSDKAYDGSPCQYCSNNPRNGGSGICHCILGQQTIYY